MLTRDGCFIEAMQKGLKQSISCSVLQHCIVQTDSHTRAHVHTLTPRIMGTLQQFDVALTIIPINNPRHLFKHVHAHKHICPTRTCAAAALLHYMCTHRVMRLQ